MNKLTYKRTSLLNQQTSDENNQSDASAVTCKQQTNQANTQGNKANE
jgi:hypothetical protein